ncbi:hypothetical protein [Janthinobacterium sp. RB2R34]|uniref:hypothetical protein n=1 Tax=Janthinobacterium sp. RB2R34 TaxID=3424193 RepID=UPI003F23BC46
MEGIGAGAISAGGVAGVLVVAGGIVVVAAVSSRLLQPANSAQTMALPRMSLLVIRGALMIFPFGNKLRLDSLLLQSKAGIASLN